MSRGRHRRHQRRTASVLVTAGSAVAGAVAITAAPAQAAVLHGDTSTTPAPASATARIISPPVITVEKGEYLSGIAAKDCGSSGDWTGIYAANQGKISNPDLVYAGELLVLSCKTAPLPKPVVVTAAVIPQQRAIVRQYSTGGSSIGGNLSFSGLERLWIAAGGPSWAASSAASVAECESGGRQSAYNPSGASGYWQILGEVVSGDVFDPMTNARNAVAKFEASGDTWAQWVCKP